MSEPRRAGWAPGRARGDALALLAGVLAGAWLAPLLPPAAVRPAIAAVAGAGLVWAVLSLRRGRVPFPAVGLRLDGLQRSGPVFLASAAAFAAALVAAGALDPGSPGRLAEPVALAGYAAWALFQQFLTVAVVWRHLPPGLDPGAVLSRSNARRSLLTATAFALVHAPNPGLMALVWIAETVWILLFARFRNLLALAAAHAVCALAAAEALQPSWLLPTTKVGLGYFLD